jgi:hypothetical protein
MTDARPAGRPAAPPPLFTPSRLALYRDCPEAYRLRVLARHPEPATFSAALERGKAVHAALAACADAVRRGRELPTDLAGRVAAALPRECFPDERAWRAETTAALSQIAAGAGYLPGDARILGVEAFHRFPYGGDALTPPFVLGAIADLIVAARDADGVAYLNVIDWKTGGRKAVDLLQEVCLRIAARHAFRAGDYGYLVSTTVFLVDGTASAVVRDDVTCRQIWREIKGLVTAAAADRLFAPSPSNRCQWCAYFGNGCILDRPGAAGDGETAMWLEDEAGGDGGSVAR